MRLTLLCTLLLLGSLLPYSGSSQSYTCGTTVTQAEYQQLIDEQDDFLDFLEEFVRNRNEGRTLAPVDLPIQAHIIRQNDGSGGLTEVALNAAIDQLNINFAATEFTFFLCGDINYIDEDTYYDYETDQEGDLTSANNVSNRINIYFVNSITISDDGGLLCGYTYLPGGPDFIFMDNSCTSNGATLSHEMGHYFNLLHTHQGYDEPDPELVDGSNCMTAGDLLCDTPADPLLSGVVDAGCNYTGGATDPNGDPYMPDPTNLMSYAPSNCREFFTVEQVARMVSAQINDRSYLLCSLDPIVLDCDIAIPLVCDVPFSGTTIGAANAVTTYNCVNWNEQGPEVVFAVTIAETTDLTVTLSDLGADLDVFIVNACGADACLAFGDVETTLFDAAPGIYYVIVDGYQGEAGTFTITATINDCTDDCPSGSTVFVTNTDDDGPGSLRQAINCANDDPLLDSIQFNIPGTPPFIITPLSQLPAIMDEGVILDGSSQPGWFMGDIIVDGSSLIPGTYAVMQVEAGTPNTGIFGMFFRNGPVNGFGIGNGAPATNNVTFGAAGKGNIVSGNGLSGLVMLNVQGGLVESNYFGLEADGTSPNGNVNRSGVVVTLNSGDITIGGNGDAQNKLAYNLRGIEVISNSTNIEILGNEIFCNSSLGILIAGNSNNNKINPTITNATSNAIQGVAIADDIVYVYLNDTTDCADTPCQGRTFLGSTTADVDGNWTLNAPFDGGVMLDANSVVTATATDQLGNSSPFGPCAEVTATVICLPIEAYISVEEPACEFDSLTFTFHGITGSPPYDINVALDLDTMTYTGLDSGDMITILPELPLIFYEEQFAGGIPDEWETGPGSPEGAVWQWSASGEADSALVNGMPTPALYWEDRSPIASLSPENGCAMYNSDVYESGGIAEGEGPFPGDHSGSLTSPAINCTDYDNIVLTFRQYARARTSEASTLLEVSPDSGMTWIPFDINTDIIEDAETPNDDLVIVNITAVAANQPNVRLRFSWSGSYYFWLLDDVRLREFPRSLTLDFIDVTDADGCLSIVDSITTIDLMPPVRPSLQLPFAVCEEDDPIMLDPLQDGISGSWSGDGVTDNVFDPADAGHGAALLLFTPDEEECARRAFGTIRVYGPNIEVLTREPTCFGESDGQIVLDVRVIGLYEYSWEEEENGGTDTGNGLIISDLTAGTYNITLTNTLIGCSDTLMAVLGQPNELLISIDSTQDVSCNGFGDGAIFTTVTGGTGNYTFEWSNPDIGDVEDATELGPGDYSVSVTDENGCTAVAETTISEPQALTIIVDELTQISCNGENDGAIDLAVIGGTPEYSYEWSDPGLGDVQDVSDLGPGDYSITVTDANGCMASLDLTIMEPDPLIAGIDNVIDVSCMGAGDGAIDLAVAGGTPQYSYEWSDPDIGDVQDPTGLPGGTYSVTITDANGCTISLDIVVEEPENLEFSGFTVTDVSCFGESDGTITVVVQGGTPEYSYNWSDNNIGDTPMAANLVAGLYSLTVTDANECTVEGEFEVLEPDELVLTVDSVMHISCFLDIDGAIYLTTTGGTGQYAYTWSDPTLDGFEDPESLAPNTYMVTVTDENGCTDSATITIEEPDPLEIEVINITPILCFGDQNGAIEIEVLGGTPPYNYSWSNPDIGDTPNPMGLTADTYTVTVTDANGCTESLDIELTQPDAIEITILAQGDVSCEGDADGFIQLQATGGTGELTFEWSNPDFGDVSEVSQLSGGTYSVTVTDENECTASLDITIAEPEPLTINCTVVQELLTFMGNEAIAEAAIAGGTPGYSVELTGPVMLNLVLDAEGTVSFPNLSAGDYIATITDANGCISECSFTIEEIVCTIEATVETSNESCDGANDGSAAISVSGGVAPFTYEWNIDAFDGLSMSDMLPPGDYSVTITDAQLCPDTVSFTIESGLLPPVADFSFTISEPNVSFENLSQNADTYFWEFGDQETSDETDPTHIYTIGQNFTVCLTASNACGSDTVCETFELGPNTSELAFLNGCAEGFVNDTVLVPILATGFENVLGFNFSLDMLNNQIASIIRIEEGALPIDEISTNFIGDSLLTVLWFDPATEALTLPDSTELFFVEVVLTGNPGECTSLDISDQPTEISAVILEDGLDFLIIPEFDNSCKICILDKADKSGLIFKEDGTPVADVNVFCNDTLSTTTDMDGYYEFLQVPVGVDYLLVPEKDVDYRNGVDILDVIKVQRHILADELLDSPYKIISADVTNDTEINVLDIIQIMSLIIARIDSFNAVQSWRFTPESWVFQDPMEPFTPPFPESILLPNLLQDAPDQNFIAMKMGDVTLNASGNLQQDDTEIRTLGVLPLFLQERAFTEGEEAIIPLYAEDFDQIAGMQWQFFFDPSVLEIVEVIPGDLPGFSDQFVNIEDGQLSGVWIDFTGQGVTLDASVPLFSLRLRANAGITSLTDVLQLSDGTTRNFGYSQNDQRLPIVLDVRSTVSTDEPDILAKATLLKARPNPFSTQTNLQLYLPKQESIRLKVWSTDGQLISQESLQLTAGNHDITIKSHNLPAKGLYIVEVTTADTVLIEKIMFQ